MAVLTISSPVVLLTVELSISLIVPVRQDTATLTTPEIKREAGTRGMVKKKLDSRKSEQDKMQI